MDDSRIIENLIYAYAERIDAGDLEGLAALFSKGMIVSPQHGATFNGYNEVLALYQASCRIHEPPGTPLTRHLTSNVIIDVDGAGKEATARSCYTVFQATDSLPLQAIISGRYQDRFTRDTDGWHFTSREMYVDLIGDCSQHLLYSIDTLN